MASVSLFRWTSSARSDAGCVRDVNEDALLERSASGCWAVADGMGGHAVGDLASRLTIDALSRVNPSANLKRTLADSRKRLVDVNRQLRAEAARRQVTRIGSTVIAMVASDRFCGFVWAGDSRLYLLRQGQFTQLTRDHSHVEELVQQGRLTEHEARNHPAQHMITRAVGATDTLDLDESAIEVMDGDVFLLCSDGLYNEVSDDDMRSILGSTETLNAAHALVDRALANGGRDNISAVVVHAHDPLAADKTLLNPSP